MLSVAPTVVTVWRYHKQADVLHCVCTVLWCGVVLRDPPVSERHIMWQLYDSCALLFNDVCCAVPCCAAVLQDPPVSERHIMWCLYDSCAVLYVDVWYAVLSFWCSQDPPVSERHITWHLYDSDERAAAYIAGPAPCRWGLNLFFEDGWVDGWMDILLYGVEGNVCVWGWGTKGVRCACVRACRDAVGHACMGVLQPALRQSRWHLYDERLACSSIHCSTVQVREGG
jgi:hypothetical protein